MSAIARTGLLRPRLRLLGAVLLAGIVVAPLLFVGLGDPGVESDEGFYAIVVAEFVTASSDGRLRLEGEAFVNKPPFAFWLMAASVSARSLDELSLRIPSALASSAIALITLLVAHRRRGALEAIIAPILLVSAPQALFHHGWRAAVTEPWLTLWILVALVVYSQNRHRPRPQAILLGSLSILLGLTKGPIGILLVLATLAIAELIVPLAPATGSPGAPNSRSRAVGRLLVIGGAPGIVCYLAWWIWNAQSVGRIVRFVHRDWFLRALGQLQPSHVRDPLYFFDLAGSEFGFWLLALVLAFSPARWRELSRERDFEGVALRLLPIVALLLFTASISKIGWYLFPAYPALALVIAEETGRWCRHERLSPALRVLAALVVCGLLAQRAWSAYSRIPSSPPHSLKRLAELVDSRPNARVLADERLHEESARPREWNRFAIDHRLAARDWRPGVDALPDGCVFLITPRRAPFDGLPEPRRHAIVEIPKQALSMPEPDLFVFDFCAGEFARAEVE